jgi:hypothetical protein
MAFRLIKEALPVRTGSQGREIHVCANYQDVRNGLKRMHFGDNVLQNRESRTNK